jgi:hypothetical protein
MNIQYSFIPAGTVAEAELNRIYLDVGNRLCNGVIDHHHSDAPEQSATEIVLNRPELVTAQIGAEGHPMTITTHHFPDLDAISATYIAGEHLLGKPISKFHRWLASYTSAIDAGKLKLNPDNAICVYSIFLGRTHQSSIATNSMDIDSVSLNMLCSGLNLLEFLCQSASALPSKLEDTQFLRSLPELAKDIAWVENDFERYRQDMCKAELFKATLPLQNGEGYKEVNGLWISKPESALFKSWARGSGFTLTATQLSDSRIIISVPPDQDVNLKGLGERLETKETEVREQMGKQRLGQNRPGYDSPDPWYDGRSPLHHYTIIDSPRDGTVIGMEDILSMLYSYLNQNKLNSRSNN